MPHRQPYPKRHLPKIWLMTDPRLGEGLLAAVRKLPVRSGVVFRHYQLATDERLVLFRQIQRICRRRGHILLLAGQDDWLAHGIHGRPRIRAPQLLSMPVHSIPEILEAKRLHADIMFLSPVFSTRSHPGARAMGMTQFSRLKRLAGPAKVIALGGMTRNRAQTFSNRIAYGWAAIDAFAP